mgnify:CR=1 FL=1
MKAVRECSRLIEGKQCPAEGVWRPLLEIRPWVGYEKQPLGLMMSILVCEFHKQTAVLSDFLGDEGWAQITETLDKIKRPYLREATTLNFVPASDSTFIDEMEKLKQKPIIPVPTSRE